MKALDEADAMKANSILYLYEFNTFISKKPICRRFVRIDHNTYDAHQGRVGMGRI